MTRISENSLTSQILNEVLDIRESISKYSREVSTGFKVFNPGDSDQGGTVSQFRQVLERIEGYKTRISATRSTIQFQDDAMAQFNEIMTRARELATQAANEPNSASTRLQIADEVFALRDAVVSLANSKYQGIYIFGGNDTDDPPVDAVSNYTNPASGSASLRYQFDTETGMSGTRSVQVTDDISVTVNVPGNSVFDESIYALERLGRSLAGYQTTLLSGVPTGAGAAYNFPTDFSLQTTDISNALNSIISTIDNDIQPTRVILGSRLQRLETAESILQVGQTNAEEALDSLQTADPTESISNLSKAKSALEVSLTVTSQLLQQNILDFL